jgi:hypothetical protein
MQSKTPKVDEISTSPTFLELQNLKFSYKNTPTPFSKAKITAHTLFA